MGNLDPGRIVASSENAEGGYFYVADTAKIRGYVRVSDVRILSGYKEKDAASRETLRKLVAEVFATKATAEGLKGKMASFEAQIKSETEKATSAYQQAVGFETRYLEKKRGSAVYFGPADFNNLNGPGVIRGDDGGELRGTFGSGGDFVGILRTKTKNGNDLEIVGNFNRGKPNGFSCMNGKEQAMSFRLCGNFSSGVLIENEISSAKSSGINKKGEKIIGFAICNSNFMNGRAICYSQEIKDGIETISHGSMEKMHPNGPQFEFNKTAGSIKIGFFIKNDLYESYIEVVGDKAVVKDGLPKN